MRVAYPPWFRRSAWKPAFGLFLVLCGAPGVAPAADKGPTKPRDEVYEVTHGGYTEKIDPKADYKSRLPRIPPRAPAESLKAMHVLPGFRVELVAAEPLVCSVVDMAVDENGRMYVAEMIPYAEKNSAVFGSPQGRVSLLEDADGDGRYDRSTVFADKLVWPTAVACFDGGVFIASAPDVWYCQDTNGDGKADLRELVVTGFATSNPAALPNSLRWGLDNRLHGMTSIAGGSLRAVKWEGEAAGRKPQPVQARGRDFSIHPRTGELRLESGGMQHGMTFDPWGAKFESWNTGPIEMVMYDDRYVARNPCLAAPGARLWIYRDRLTVHRTSPDEPWRVLRTDLRKAGLFTGAVEGGGASGGYFTGSCGVFLYAGDAWPKEFYGNAFVCEGANNVVHRMRLAPDGVAFSAHRADAKREFLASDEVWFRPIQFCDAPDGCLWLADMYREVYEHPDAIPASVKKHIDLTTGKDLGRVYRIVPEGFQRPKPPRLGSMGTEELVALLAHPNSWHRRTASRLLYERQETKAAALLDKLAADSPSPLGRMHALYALDGQGALTAEAVSARLADPHARVREHAVRLAERVLADAPAVREKLYAMTADADLRVRYQLAFTLGEIAGSQATGALARIAARDPGDRWIRLAVLSSSLGRAGELFSRLMEDVNWRKTRDAAVLLEEIAEQAGLQGRADQVAEVLRGVDAIPAANGSLAQAIVRGLNRGLNKSGSPQRQQIRLRGGTRAGLLLAEIVRQATSLAADERQPAPVRVEAIHWLALAPLAEARSVLADLVESRQAREVQLAAIDSLGRFSDPEVAAILVEAWPTFSPQVRNEAAEVLFARRDRLAALLTAVEKKAILPSQIDPSRVQLLVTHADPEVRAKASRLLAGEKLGRRQDVVATYRSVLRVTGDVGRGRAVFRRDCATCHKLEGVGFETGLPLTNIQNKGAEFVLIHILDPNLQVLPNYINYVCLMKDGRSVTGIISSETATSITLLRAEGVSETVLRANIDRLESTGMSLMPEGLEKQVNQREMADLIEYLLNVRG